MKIKKTRILFVLIQLDAGGSERVVLDLARNLASAKFDVYVAAFMGGVLEASFKEVCKEVFVITKKPGFDVGAMLQISSLIKKNNIDVVNAHHYMPCFYSFLGCCVLRRRRLIYTEHSVPEVHGVAESKHRKMLNTMLWRINAVIGVSEEITNTFKKHYPKHEKKFRMVVNGVDVGKFCCQEKRERTRNMFGFQTDDFVVGMVANLKKVKNHACLIRAVNRLKDKRPQLKVLLVGTGFPGDPDNTEADLKRMVQELGLQNHVIFAGYQSDIPAMLSAMDCFCLSSYSEGLPVSVLEAMAAGLVVVASDVSGIKEVVEHAVTGYLFPSDDDDMLSRKLFKLSTEKIKNEMEVNIKRTVNEKFSKNVWVKKCEVVLLK